MHFYRSAKMYDRFRTERRSPQSDHDFVSRQPKALSLLLLIQFGSEAQTFIPVTHRCVGDGV